nr:unnamed protein product [Digitaria exilis]
MVRFLGAGQEQEEFFDSRDVLSPASVSSPASSGRHDDGWLFDESLLEVWVRDPCSVQERRHRFVKSLGLLDPSSNSARADEKPCSRPEATEEILPASPIAELFSAALTFASRGGEPTVSSDDGAGTEEVELECVFKNLDDGTMFVVDEMGKDGSFRILWERRSNKTVTATEFEQTFGSSPFIRELMRRVGDSDEPSTPEKIVMRRKRRRLGWLRRLGIGACVVDAEEDDEINSTSSSSYRSCSGKVDRVKVRPYTKRSKELSAVYKGQVIKAHEGAIVTMKFSSDGQYLATGAPINSCEGGKGKHSKSSKGAADPACVVIPHRTFALSEDPVHEFHGHDDVILDLSWSKNRELLSASMDKTVRLWKVGCNSYLKVFSHNNYVTCIKFKPTNDDYFISGCIDGMVHIWDVPRCQVLDWADSKEIVTAVCYRPDGKGAVVGTLTGNCRYYDASDYP